MIVWSWNVNGIRAAAKKGLLDWLEEGKGSIIGLQEVRATEDQMSDEIRAPKGWHSTWVSAKKKGYSGVGIYSRRPADEVITTMNEREFDEEGRTLLARFGRLWVANIYFPNGSGLKARDNSRVPYKLAFYRRLHAMLEPMKSSGERVLVMGDFNTAHQEIDLARPKNNKKTSGFLPEEREEFDRWIASDWTDTFRHYYPDKEEVYSWWSQRFGMRGKNVGWRIDYVLASPAAMDFVQDAMVATDVMGSDHCPVGVKIDDRVMG